MWTWRELKALLSTALIASAALGAFYGVTYGVSSGEYPPMFLPLSVAGGIVCGLLPSLLFLALAFATADALRGGQPAFIAAGTVAGVAHSLSGIAFEAWRPDGEAQRELLYWLFGFGGYWQIELLAVVPGRWVLIFAASAVAGGVAGALFCGLRSRSTAAAA